MGLERHDTIVIGGGQAGLATGYHLRRQQQRFVILDAERRVGGAWRRRWDSLRLFTPASYSSLPGMTFPGEPRSFPTKDEMADYLEAYAARFQLPVELDTAVDGLRGQDGRYQVTAGHRRFEADQVVVATGAFQAPRVPSFADELDAAVRQLHSSAYRHPSQLLDGPVLVVGAGNSGAEIAVELAATHRTWLSGRSTGRPPVAHGGRLYWLLVGGQRSPYWWLMHERLTTDTRAGRKVREQALRRGRR